MRKPVVVVVSLLLALCAAAAAADGQKVYKWTDDQGVVHYSDTAPKDAGADVTTVDMPDFPPQDPVKLAQLQAAWAATAAAWQQAQAAQDQQQHLAAATAALAQQQAQFAATLAALQQSADDMADQQVAYPIYFSSGFVPSLHRNNRREQGLFAARHPRGKGGPALMHIPHLPLLPQPPNKT